MQDKKGIVFPLFIAGILMIIAILIGRYVISLMNQKPYQEYVINEEYTLNIYEDAWITDDSNQTVIGADIREFAYADGNIFFLRELDDGEIEVGRYDTKIKYLVENTSESYKELKQEFIDRYGIIFSDVDSIKINLEEERKGR